MPSPPTALGLTVCDYVIIEQGSQKATLVGVFAGAGVESFPAKILPFCVFSRLTDAIGDVTMELYITNLETDEEVYSFQTTVHFPDKLREVIFLLRISQLQIPSEGNYQFTLLADGHWVTQQRVKYYKK